MKKILKKMFAMISINVMLVTLGLIAIGYFLFGDWDKEKDSTLPPFTKNDAERYYKDNF